MTPQSTPESVRAANPDYAPRSFVRCLVRPWASSLIVAMSVLLSLLVVAGPAEAGTIHRTRAELSYGWSVLRLLNAERHAHHLPALKYDARLRVSARRHNLTMARANTLSHQLPGEADFARRITATGYQWTFAGENIGWNSDTSRRGVLVLEKVMYQEQPPNDGHRQNILSRNYRNVGVDVYVDRAHHKVWLTTDFGRR